MACCSKVFPESNTALTQQYLCRFPNWYCKTGKLKQIVFQALRFKLVIIGSLGNLICLQRLEEFEEALVAFRQLLELSANYVPALQGQGEAAFRLAEKLRQEQRLGCARDRCQEAIDAFTK